MGLAGTGARPRGQSILKLTQRSGKPLSESQNVPLTRVTRVGPRPARQFLVKKRRVRQDSAYTILNCDSETMIVRLQELNHLGRSMKLDGSLNYTWRA